MAWRCHGQHAGTVLAFTHVDKKQTALTLLAEDYPLRLLEYSFTCPSSATTLPQPVRQTLEAPQLCLHRRNAFMMQSLRCSMTR